MGTFSEENVKCDSLTSSCIKDAGIIFENYVLENLYILCKKMALKSVILYASFKVKCKSVLWGLFSVRTCFDE